MKTGFLIVIFLFFTTLSLYAVTCGPPFGFGVKSRCMDGTFTTTCCGAGKSDFLHPLSGCSLFCGICKDGCRPCVKIEYCYEWCDHWKQICEGGCALVGPDERCSESCEVQKQRCYDGCIPLCTLDNNKPKVKK